MYTYLVFGLAPVPSYMADTLSRTTLDAPACDIVTKSKRMIV